MNDEERRHYARDGFLLREAVFAAAELQELRGVFEEVVARVKRRAARPDAGPEIQLADGHRLQLSSRAAIQSEWDEGSREIRLVEPCDHLHPRFVEPMRDAVSCEDLSLFTTELNLKRPREVSEFPYHQDYPYWYVRIEEQAHDVATAILFLDDADATNGGLRVLPGSHQRGPARPTRSRGPHALPGRPLEARPRDGGRGGGSGRLRPLLRLPPGPPLRGQPAPPPAVGRCSPPTSPQDACAGTRRLSIPSGWSACCWGP